MINNNQTDDTKGEWYDADPSTDYQKALDRATYLKNIYETEYDEDKEMPYTRYEQIFKIRNDLQDYEVTDRDIENIINELYN
jgi:hypothetical protein